MLAVFHLFEGTRRVSHSIKTYLKSLVSRLNGGRKWASTLPAFRRHAQLQCMHTLHQSADSLSAVEISMSRLWRTSYRQIKVAGTADRVEDQCGAEMRAANWPCLVSFERRPRSVSNIMREEAYISRSL